jgi:Helix-turn-helix domain
MRFMQDAFYSLTPIYPTQLCHVGFATGHSISNTTHVLRLARDGKIPAHDVGCGMKRRHWRFLLSQLDEWSRSRTNVATDSSASLPASSIPSPNKVVQMVVPARRARA